MKYWLLTAAVLTLPAANAAAVPVTLFSGTLTADAGAPAPLGYTASLASPNDPMGGGVITGDLGVTAPSAGTFTITLQDLGSVPGGVFGSFYEVILDGLSLGLTAQVPIGGATASAGTFAAAVGAGFHDIGVFDPVLTFLPAALTSGNGTATSDFLLTVAFDATPAAVPEAPTLALLSTALGILGIGIRRRVPVTV